MEISFKFRSKPYKDGTHALNIQFTNGRDYQLEKFTGMKIIRKFWINKDSLVQPDVFDKEDSSKIIKKGHPAHKVINLNLLKFQEKMIAAKLKFAANDISFEQAVAFVFNSHNLDNIKTIDDCLHNMLRQELTIAEHKNQTHWLNGYKKLIGYDRDKMLFFKDINSSLIAKAHAEAKRRIVKVEDLRSKTYLNYLGCIRSLCTYAKNNKLIDEEILFPRKFYKVPIQATEELEGNDPAELWKMIEECRSLEQWQAAAFWLLAFSLKGLYFSDITTLSDSKIKDIHGKNISRNLWLMSQSKVHIKHLREKTKVPVFTRIFPTTMWLIRRLKLSTVITHGEKLINGERIVADINDQIGIFNYDKEGFPAKHKQVGKNIQKKTAIWGIQQKKARKSFNQTADDMEIGAAVRGMLLGHKDQVKTLIAKSYNFRQKQVWIDKIDAAHVKVLKEFKFEKLTDALVAKLKVIVELQQLPKWLLAESGVHRVGRELKVLTGFKNRKAQWTKIEPKYKWYFKLDKTQGEGFWSDDDTYLDSNNARYITTDQDGQLVQGDLIQKQIKEKMSNLIDKAGFQITRVDGREPDRVGLLIQDTDGIKSIRFQQKKIDKAEQTVREILEDSGILMSKA